MKVAASSLPLLAILTQVAADNGGVWGQCGGVGYTGTTVCDPISTCVYINEFYSCCKPKPATTATSTIPTASTATATSTTRSG
ncbi:hypothetical protein BDV93DRAFT_550178 [Ceratobasidium sp. AG-I]|nr:hypothetical protein BDV93DRAFT_550178 [Ceratobasidium sp. AG-I]